MPVLKTCRSCTRAPDCDRRRALIEAVRGHGVGTITHRCPEHEARYRRGQAVWVHVNECPWAECDGDDPDDVPTRDWFPGTFSDVATPNTRGTVVVHAGAVGESGATVFKPINDARPFVFCRVPWRRIREREAPDEYICPKCAEPFRVTGSCGSDPDYCATSLSVPPTDGDDHA